MPIHLPPISRREFLRRTLVAGAALATLPALAAVGRKTELDEFALLSDIHIAGNQTTVQRGINMAEHLRIVGRELLAQRRNPAGVFITGDCALGDGQVADYESLVRLLDPMRSAGMTVHLALGNHDQRENFREILKPASSPVASHQASLIRSRRANWFVLDSLEKTLQTPGLIGQAQLDWLAKSLDANTTKPAIVLVHHNPGIEGNMGLKDTLAFYEIIRPRKQVKAYIFGHTHKWKVWEDPSGIHLVNLPPVAYIFQQGDPAGWVHATTRHDGLRLRGAGKRCRPFPGFGHCQFWLRSCSCAPDRHAGLPRFRRAGDCGH